MELAASPCKSFFFLEHQILLFLHAAYDSLVFSEVYQWSESRTIAIAPTSCPWGNNVRKKYLVLEFFLTPPGFRRICFTNSALWGLLQSRSFLCLTLFSYPFQTDISLSSLLQNIFVRACILVQLSHSHNTLFKLACSKLMPVLCSPGYSLSLQEETAKDTPIARSTKEESTAILITSPRKMHEPSKYIWFYFLFPRRKIIQVKN